MVAAFITARNLCVPLKYYKLKHKYSPFWTPLCSEAKSSKKKAAKALRKCNNIQNQIEFKKCKSTFKRIIASAKRVYWEKFCSGINKQTNLKHVWDTISKLKGKQINSNIKIRNKDKSLIDEAKLPEIFAKNFYSISSDKNIDPAMLENRKVL